MLVQDAVISQLQNVFFVEYGKALTVSLFLFFAYVMGGRLVEGRGEALIWKGHGCSSEI